MFTSEEERRLVCFYIRAIQREEARNGKLMNFSKRVDFVKRLFSLVQARVSIARPEIRFFHEKDPIFFEECFDPLGDSTTEYESSDGLRYHFDPGTGKLVLSGGFSRLSSVVNVIKGFHGHNPLHVEIILSSELEKVHCFRRVTQVAILPSGLKISH